MEQILIKNFKAIINKEERPIKVKKMTVLMGEQGSGKSTVAKLVYFFKTIREEITLEIIENDTLTVSNYEILITNRIRSYFVYLFGATRHMSNFHVTYTYENGKQINLSQNAKGNLHFDMQSFSPLLNQVVQLKSELNRTQISFNDLAQRERNRVINGIDRLMRKQFGSNQMNLFLPASRNMTVTLEHHLTEIYAKLENTIALTLDLKDKDRFQSENELILLKFMQYARFMKSKFQRAGSFQGLISDERQLNPNLNFIDAQNLIGKIELILKGRYLSDRYGEKIFFSKQDYVFLQNASSGQQESIRTLQDIFLNILYGDPIFRVIEEPESHLFASAQKHLIEALAILSNTNLQNQLLITTHSTFILRVLDNLLKAFQINSSDVERIIDRKAWMNFDEFAAYNLVNGEIEDALNQEFKGVDARLFDDVTQQISNEFDELLTIQYP